MSSPERRRVVRMEDSREAWKDKAMERAVEIRRLKMSLSDIEDSREKWRLKAKEAEKKAEKIEQEKEQIIAEFKPSFKFFFVTCFSVFACIVLFPFVLVVGFLMFCGHIFKLCLAFRGVRHMPRPSRIGRSKLAYSSLKMRRNKMVVGQPLRICPFKLEKIASPVFSELNSRGLMKVAPSHYKT